MNQSICHRYWVVSRMHKSHFIPHFHIFRLFYRIQNEVGQFRYCIGDQPLPNLPLQMLQRGCNMIIIRIPGQHFCDSNFTARFSRVTGIWKQCQASWKWRRRLIATSALPTTRANLFQVSIIDCLVFRHLDLVGRLTKMNKIHARTFWNVSDHFRKMTENTGNI